MTGRTKALVTGGAGFIGAHLVRALVQRGFDVLILDNFVTGSPRNLSSALDVALPQGEAVVSQAHGQTRRITDQCELMVGNVRDRETLRHACEGVELIYHQAALRSVPRSLEDPLATHDVNATGTLHLLEAARRAGVRRVVYASSSSVYGDTPVPKHEGQVPQPKSPYAASKLTGEGYCQTYSRAFGLPTISLRYFNVFGPWQDPASEYAAVIPKFIRLALQGEPLPVHGDGLQSRDFTYVDNVVDANLKAAAADTDVAVLNVGAGERHTLLDLIARIGEHLGRELELEHEPPRAGDVRHTEADITLSRKTIGYSPTVDFDTGLRLTIDAMRKD